MQLEAYQATDNFGFTFLSTRIPQTDGGLSYADLSLSER